MGRNPPRQADWVSALKGGGPRRKHKSGATSGAARARVFRFRARAGRPTDTDNVGQISVAPSTRRGSAREARRGNLISTITRGGGRALRRAGARPARERRGNPEAGRYADLSGPGGRAAQLRRPPRGDLRDGPYGRAVLQRLDPG